MTPTENVLPGQPGQNGHNAESRAETAKSLAPGHALTEMLAKTDVSDAHQMSKSVSQIGDIVRHGAGGDSSRCARPPAAKETITGPENVLTENQANQDVVGNQKTEKHARPEETNVQNGKDGPHGPVAQ